MEIWREQVFFYPLKVLEDPLTTESHALQLSFEIRFAPSKAFDCALTSDVF